MREADPAPTTSISVSAIRELGDSLEWLLFRCKA
jgi:hypothetical protein